MGYYIELERFETLKDKEAVVVMYDQSRRKLAVKVEYDYKTISERPVLYSDGRIVYNFPERVSDRTKKKAEELMRQINKRYLALAAKIKKHREEILWRA